jgi:hypothetical protein
LAEIEHTSQSAVVIGQANGWVDLRSADYIRVGKTANLLFAPDMVKAVVNWNGE